MSDSGAYDPDSRASPRTEPPTAFVTAFSPGRCWTPERPFEAQLHFRDQVASLESLRRQRLLESVHEICDKPILILRWSIDDALVIEASVNALPWVEHGVVEGRTTIEAPGSFG